MDGLAMYLTKRYRTWWALHDVPTLLRSAIGTARLTKSLGTDDEKQARRMAALLWLHDWSRRIEEAKRGTALGGQEREAAFFRSLIRNARSDEEAQTLKEHVADVARDRMIKAAEMAGVEGYEDPAFEQVPGVVAARQFEAFATGAVVATTEHVEEWLASLGDTKKTKDMKRSEVLRFAVSFPLLSNITRREVQKWINDRVIAEKLTSKTIGRNLSFLRSYWKYLRSLELVSSEDRPFFDLTIPEVKKNGNWKPFVPAEVVKLAKAAEERGDQQLADLIQLAMWSGARIAELCALKVDAVTADQFDVVDAKTDAGVREVPVHPQLAPTMQRLIKDSKDGFVISGLPENKYGDRSNSIGKRFKTLKENLGFSDRHVFHSIRKTVVTLLENAGVSENVTADVVGHEKPRITYGLYSGGATLTVKAEALRKINYPKS